jgi:hypothetical protein
VKQFALLIPADDFVTTSFIGKSLSRELHGASRLLSAGARLELKPETKLYLLPS